MIECYLSLFVEFPKTFLVFPITRPTLVMGRVAKRWLWVLKCFLIRLELRCVTKICVEIFLSLGFEIFFWFGLLKKSRVGFLSNLNQKKISKSKLEKISTPIFVIHLSSNLIRKKFQNPNTSFGNPTHH